MALKIGPIDGHTVMLDAQSDPNMIWILCSCGAVLNVEEPPSGKSLRESITKITEHLGEPPIDEEEVNKRMAIFDSIFPPEED